MNKKKTIQKCSRGQKFCKNPQCREALHIHRHICVKCNFINDRSKFTTKGEREEINEIYE